MLPVSRIKEIEAAVEQAATAHLIGHCRVSVRLFWLLSLMQKRRSCTVYLGSSWTVSLLLAMPVSSTTAAFTP